MMVPLLSWIIWNPPREAFSIPYFHHSIAWYGLLFVTGFLFGYAIIMRFLRKELTLYGEEHAKQTSHFLADRLCWFVVLGTILGARLGEVLFYDWDYYQTHTYQILQIWKGGLSSHGAGVGIMTALYLYHRRYRRIYSFLTFFYLLDLIVIPTGLAGFFIRIGNFVNQEIVGIPTSLPWGIIFLNPADGSIPEPRHPVQLYEGICYLAIFFILFSCRNIALRKFRSGFLSGLFFVLVFTSRFLLEFFKAPFPGAGVVAFHIQQGQYLSIPYILGGMMLILYACWPLKSRMTAKTRSKT